MLPPEGALLPSTRTRNADSGADLPLALLHLRRRRSAFLDRSHAVLRGDAKIRARDAQIDLPDPARILQRRLELISRTSPILVASSANTCAIATLLAAKLQASKKTAISASSLTIHIYSPAARGLASKLGRACSPRELRPIINLLPLARLTRE